MRKIANMVLGKQSFEGDDDSHVALIHGNQWRFFSPLQGIRMSRLVMDSQLRTNLMDLRFDVAFFHCHVHKLLILRIVLLHLHLPFPLLFVE